MERRSYNIFFHLHTVSGIVISVLLYVIFFAGSFSFFRADIINWERDEPVSDTKQLDIDVDAALDSLQKKYPLYGRDIKFTRVEGERRIMIDLSDSKDTLLRKDQRAGTFFYLDPSTYKKYNYQNSYSMGEFIYRLHFFAQIPYPAGYYLSGFTALFFLFAILTGILVHWKHIVSNFYVFRPWEKLKTLWTDAHTVLGTIGLPFQTLYAVTGAFFMINILIVVPSVLFFYNGDQAKIYEDLGYASPKYAFAGKKLEAIPNIAQYVKKTESTWQDFSVTRVSIYNFGDAGMHIETEGDLKNDVRFIGEGSLTFDAATGKITATKDPYQTPSYIEGVRVSLYKLHFGSYGGYYLRVLSFVLGLITCFVIISGVLIWLEARNKKNIPEKKKRFNAWVGYSYLAICLSLYPVTAFALMASRIFSKDITTDRQTTLYAIFFGAWLIVAIFFTLRKNNYFTNRYTLLSGGILGLFVPVVHGIVTQKWFWITWTSQQHDLFVVDALWLALSAVSLAVVFTMKRSVERT